MNYNMKRPCSDCPFLRDGGIPLRPARICEISKMMLNRQGGQFPCHKTVDYKDGDPAELRDTAGESHCAGALIYAEKHHTATQMMRIAERLGMYDHSQLDPAAFSLVWNSQAEWIEGGKA